MGTEVRQHTLRPAECSPDRVRSGRFRGGSTSLRERRRGRCHPRRCRRGPRETHRLPPEKSESPRHPTGRERRRDAAAHHARMRPRDQRRPSAIQSSRPGRGAHGGAELSRPGERLEGPVRRFGHLESRGSDSALCDGRGPRPEQRLREARGGRDGAGRLDQGTGRGHLLEPGPPGGPNPRRALFSALPKPADLAGRVDGYAAILVEVEGEKDGHDVVHTIYAILGHREASQRFGATATAYLTASGAAAGAILLVSGSIREKGKLSPENLDPKPFFPLLRKFGIDVKERVRSARSLA